MLPFRRLAPLVLLVGLPACGGSDPAGDAVIFMPAPTPTPTPTPTPNPNFAETTRNGVTISSGQQAAIVTAGTNNVIDGRDPVAANRAAQGSTTQVPPFDALMLNANGSAFLVRTSFIGAVDPANPSTFEGWTCSTARSCDTSGIVRQPKRPDCPPTTSAYAIDGFESIGFIRLCTFGNQVTQDVHLQKLPGILYVINPGGAIVGRDVGARGDAPNGLGVTLTIDAGVVLQGDSDGFYANVLRIQRGSRLIVNGTREDPVTITGALRVAIAGRAPISNCKAGTSTAAGTCENLYSAVGIRANLQIASYGGNLPDDTSGSIHHLRMVDSDNLSTTAQPGLNLLGTGSGTLIDHVQVSGPNGDGVVVHGGTTNLSHILVDNPGDEGFSIGEGWRGAAQFLLITQSAAPGASDNPRWMLEADSLLDDDALPRTRGTIANFTFVQSAAGHVAPVLIGNGVDFTLANGIIKTPNACVTMAASTTANGGVPSTVRPASGTNGVPLAIDDAGPPRFFSTYFACLGR